MIADLHTHNFFSFDSDAVPDDCFSEAYKTGADVIAVTNHYDIDGIIAGIYPAYDETGDRAASEAAQHEYNGRLGIIRGIELGQPHLYQREALGFIERNGFEYVLVSMHNMRGIPDFYFWDFTKLNDMQCEYWFRMYLGQIEEMLTFPVIDALAHITYPYRYMLHGGRKPDLNAMRDRFADIFRILISRGIALEVNTSGLRQGMGVTLPDETLIRLYRECGGELTVIGSDAHFPCDIAADVMSAQKLLKACGFDSSYIIKNHTPEPYRLCE